MVFIRLRSRQIPAEAVVYVGSLLINFLRFQVFFSAWFQRWVVLLALLVRRGLICLSCLKYMVRSTSLCWIGSRMDVFRVIYGLWPFFLALMGWPPSPYHRLIISSGFDRAGLGGEYKPLLARERAQWKLRKNNTFWTSLYARRLCSTGTFLFCWFNRICCTAWPRTEIPVISFSHCLHVHTAF